MTLQHPMTPTDTLLTLGATMRLTRVVVEDDIGVYARMPVINWVRKHHPNYASFIADGMTCPNCVGYWVGVGVLTTTIATKGTRLERPWRWLMAGLTLNLVNVVAGRAVDYWG